MTRFSSESRRLSGTAPAIRSEPIAWKDQLMSLIPNMRAFALFLCGDRVRADDLVQDTLLKAWEHQDSFQAGTNLRAWLFTILRNTFYSDCRRRKREVEDGDGAWAASLAVHAGQQGVSDLHDLQTALASLPADQREALILIGAAGFSYEEAAEVCECAVGTVQSRVNRARHKLAAVLGVSRPEEFGPDATSEAIVERAHLPHR